MNNNQLNSMHQNIPMTFISRRRGPNTPHVFDSIKDKKFPYGYETNPIISDFVSLHY